MHEEVVSHCLYLPFFFNDILSNNSPSKICLENRFEDDSREDATFSVDAADFMIKQQCPYIRVV